jgi:hypothetical protein
VFAGATSVTLITPSEYSRFSVGSAVALTGVSTQTNGYPPNFQLYEYKLITAIATDCPSPCSSSTITLNAPLTNTLKSTWPDLGIVDGPTPLGGPAKIYQLPSSWQTNAQVFGLTLVSSLIQDYVGANFAGSDIQFIDVGYEGRSGWGIGTMNNFTATFFNLPGGTEWDKNLVNATCNFCTGRGWSFASASPFNLRIVSSLVGPGNGIGGLAQNAVLKNVVVDGGRITLNGGYGAPNSVQFDTVTYNSSAQVSNHWIKTTDLTFSSGTWSMLKTAPTLANFYATLIPGAVLYYGDANGNNNCSPLLSFTITDISEDSTHVYASTNIGPTLPTVTCFGPVSFSSLGMFAVPTAVNFSQYNSGPGNIANDPQLHP